MSWQKQNYYSAAYKMRNDLEQFLKDYYLQYDWPHGQQIHMVRLRQSEHGIRTEIQHQSQ